MLLEDLHRQPGHLIRRAQQIAVAIFIEECAAFDLTPVQYAAMVAIQENEGIDATRLSAQIAFDRSTLGNVLERLEARGFVERYPSPDDKRIKLLKLTAQGQFSYSLDAYRRRPVGYWIKDSKTIDVPAGAEPLTIRVPAYPAGAIYGKIFRADGTLAKNVRASLLTVERPDPFGHSLSNSLDNRVELGTYNATPPALDGLVSSR